MASPFFWSRCGLLGLQVEAIAGLDLGVFLFHGKMEGVIAGSCVGLVRRIAEHVLTAKLVVEVGVDLVESFFLGDFKETASGSFCDLLEDFLAVGA